MSLTNRPIRQLAATVRSGEFSFSELVDEAIANRNADLGAYRHLNDDQVRAHAQARDATLAAGDDLGPMMGMPVSVKDLYGAPGFPTSAGSPKDLPESFTTAGPVVQSLLDHGIVPTGKTHTVEFAFGGLGTNPHSPTPRNPWDSNNHRVPGGSSSCLLYTSPSPRDATLSRMPSSA